MNDFKRLSGKNLPLRLEGKSIFSNECSVFGTLAAFVVIGFYALSKLQRVGNIQSLLEYQIGFTQPMEMYKNTYTGGLYSFDYNEIPEDANTLDIRFSNFSTCG